MEKATINKKIILIIIIFIFSFVNLSGCEEFDDIELKNPNYKYVTVSVTAKVGVGPLEEKLLPDMQIEIRIEKDGAVQKSGFVTTNNAGVTPPVTYTVQLYKEQDITVTGNLLSVLPQEYIDQGYSVWTIDYQVYTWDIVNSLVDWGETTSWSPILYFTVTKI